MLRRTKSVLVESVGLCYKEHDVVDRLKLTELQVISLLITACIMLRSLFCYHIHVHNRSIQVIFEVSGLAWLHPHVFMLYMHATHIFY